MRTRLLNPPRQPASQPASSRSASPQRRPMSVWLSLARAAFIALGIVALIACVASVPAAVARFGSICTSKVASNCPDAQATAAGASTLQSLGISLHVYAIYTVTLILVATVIYVVVAGLIFWRHSDS